MSRVVGSIPSIGANLNDVSRTKYGGEIVGPKSFVTAWYATRLVLFTSLLTTGSALSKQGEYPEGAFFD